MKGLKKVYVCSECGHTESKWNGQCPSCGAWNSAVEVEKEAEKALDIHKHIIKGDATFVNEKVTFGQVWEDFLS